MSSDNKILSQVSQVIIKLLVAKIIIKVLFLPVTPVTAPTQMKYSGLKSNPFLVREPWSPVLGPFSHNQCCVLLGFIMYELVT